MLLTAALVRIAVRFTRVILICCKLLGDLRFCVLRAFDNTGSATFVSSKRICLLLNTPTAFVGQRFKALGQY